MFAHRPPPCPRSGRTCSRRCWTPWWVAHCAGACWWLCVQRCELQQLAVMPRHCHIVLGSSAHDSKPWYGPDRSLSGHLCKLCLDLSTLPCPWSSHRCKSQVQVIGANHRCKSQVQVTGASHRCRSAHVSSDIITPAGHSLLVCLLPAACCCLLPCSTSPSPPPSPCLPADRGGAAAGRLVSAAGRFR
jgi:hypothetical protein